MGQRQDGLQEENQEHKETGSFVAGSWYWQFVRKNDANLKCSEGCGELNRPFLIY